MCANEPWIDVLEVSVGQPKTDWLPSQPLELLNEFAGLDANLDEPSNGFGAARDILLSPPPVVDLLQPLVSDPHVELLAVIQGLSTHPNLWPMDCIAHIDNILHIDVASNARCPF